MRVASCAALLGLLVLSCVQQGVQAVPLPDGAQAAAAPAAEQDVDAQIAAMIQVRLTAMAKLCSSHRVGEPSYARRQHLAPTKLKNSTRRVWDLAD